jgi:hypothetical protein
MPKAYRIEIDVSVDDGADASIMELARIQHQSHCQAWTERKEERVPIPADEFIQDVETALLELIEAGFRDAVPHAEPHGFRCVPISEGTIHPNG